MKEPERRYQRRLTWRRLSPVDGGHLAGTVGGRIPNARVGPAHYRTSPARRLPSTDWLRPSPLDSHGGLRDSANSLDRAAGDHLRILYPAPTPTPSCAIPPCCTVPADQSSRPAAPAPAEPRNALADAPVPCPASVLLLPVPPRPFPAPEPAPRPPVLSPPRRRSRGVLRFVFIALVFAGLGYAGWFGWKVVRARPPTPMQPTAMRRYLP